MQEFLADLWRQRLPFVFFRFPQEKQIHCYYQVEDQAYWTDNFEEDGFVFAPFLSQQRQLMIPSTYRKSFRAVTPPSSTSVPQLPQEGKTAFTEKVAAAVHEIGITNLEKVVLSILSICFTICEMAFHTIKTYFIIARIRLKFITCGNA